MKRKKLSVLVLVYNHGKFLERTLQSIFEQRTDFDFDVHVAEDHSTDNSAEILKRFQAMYPDRLHLHLSDHNRGSKLNSIAGLRQLQSEYITILDGDDHWCDSTKLQRQVTFLDQNPSYAACAHNTLLHYDDGSQPDQAMLGSGLRDTYTIHDLVGGKAYFHISSVVARNIFFGHVPESFNHELAGDRFLTMLYAERGPVYYMDRVMSVYVLHAGGQWGRLSKLEQAMCNVDGLAFFQKAFQYRFAEDFVHLHYASKAVIKRLLKERWSPWLIFKYGFLALSVSRKGRPRNIVAKFFRSLYEVMDHYSTMPLKSKFS